MVKDQILKIIKAPLGAFFICAKLVDVSANPPKIQSFSTDTSNVISVEEIKRAKMLADISLKLNVFRPNFLELIHEGHSSIMKICKVCLEISSELKTNTHVIPRFILKNTKTVGRNVFFDGKKVIRRNQRDITVNQLWCEKCELRFKECDDFAKSFFDDRAYYLHSLWFDLPIGKREWEVHDPIAVMGLKKFIIGVTLRHSIFLENDDGTNLLGPYFDKLREYYLKGDFNNTEFVLSGFKYNDCGIVGFPTRERVSGLNAIYSIIKGYRLWIITDKREINLDYEKIQICSPAQLNFICMPFKETGLNQTLVELVANDLASKKRI